MLLLLRIVVGNKIYMLADWIFLKNILIGQISSHRCALAVFARDVAYFHRPITRAACDFRSAGCIRIEGLPASSLLRSCAGVRVRIRRYWPLAHVILSALAVFARDVAYCHRPITRAACGFRSAGRIRIEGLPAWSLLRACAGVRARISRYWPLAHVILSALAVFAREGGGVLPSAHHSRSLWFSLSRLHSHWGPTSLEPASVACGRACTYP